MQSNEKALSPQDAVDSFDRLRASRVTFGFANESDAEQWDRDGRVDDVDESPLPASPFSER